ncbi:MAG: hypothetical protein GQ565_10955 [Candidatus Aegiribacteria sp.]|nr:hypothetical protein [Candidatus Aegiribacteria sp.]
MNSLKNTDAPNIGNIREISLHKTDVLGVTLFDLDCFSSGIMPGMIVDEDGLGTSAITSFTIAVNIGRMFDIAEAESILVEYSNRIVIITPFAFDSLILVILARRTASLWNLRRKINKLIAVIDEVLDTDTAWKQKIDDPASQRLTCNVIRPALSLICLSGVSMQRILLLFQGFLRDFGYPEQLLEADAKRRQMIEHLRCACAGICDGDSIEFVSRICEAEGIPRIEHFLGKGFWGAVYMLTNNTVLKITRDEKEARTSASIIGKHNSCIVDIFQVYRLSICRLRTPYYFIVRENIDTHGMLGDEDAELLELTQQIMSESYKEQRIEPFEERKGSLGKNRCRHLREKAGIAAMKIMRELKNNSIVFNDFHKDNIGVKNGQFCIFDLSLSEGQPVSMDEIEIDLNL